MPKCKKCEKHFPNRMTIGNKVHVLRSRKYCLECSPFGQHNTKQIHIESVKDDKRCECGRLNFNGKSKCWTCIIKHRKHEAKRKALEYKGGKCLICGYDKSRRALTFHHLDPEQKSFGISSMGFLGFERLKKELDKCILVCANCHEEIHDGLHEDLMTKLMSDNPSVAQMVRAAA